MANSNGMQAGARDDLSAAGSASLPDLPTARPSLQRTLRSSLGIGVRWVKAAATADHEAMQRERALLSRLLMQGDAMRSHRVDLGLEMLRDEVDSVSFTRKAVSWNALARCTVITPSLLVRGAWQDEDMDDLIGWLSANGYLEGKKYFLDVGANIGTSTIPLALRSNLSALAIEPVGDNFRMLQANIVSNGLADRVVAVKKAVSERAERITMSQDPYNSGGAEVRIEHGVQGFGRSGAYFETVDAEPLDAIVAEAGLPVAEIAFAWIDTQGFEHKVLRSAKTLWSQGVPCYVEVWPAGLEAHGGKASFLDFAMQSFSQFVPYDEMRNPTAGARRPIAAFPDFFETLTGNGHDVLFLK